MNCKLKLLSLTLLIISLSACEQENLVVETPINMEEEPNQVESAFRVNNDVVIYNGETLDLDNAIVNAAIENGAITVVSYPTNINERVDEPIEVIPHLFDTEQETNRFIETQNELIERSSCNDCFDLFLFNRNSQNELMVIMHNLRIGTALGARNYNIPSIANDKTNSFRLVSDNGYWRPFTWQVVSIRFYEHYNQRGKRGKYTYYSDLYNNWNDTSRADLRRNLHNYQRNKTSSIRVWIYGGNGSS